MLNFQDSTTFNYIFPVFQPMHVIGLRKNVQSKTEISAHDLDEASLFDTDEMQIDKIYQCLQSEFS